MKISIQSPERHLEDLKEHLDLIENIRIQVGREIAHKCRIFKTILICLLAIYILVLCSIAIEKSWLVSLLGAVIPALAWVLGLITKHEWTPRSLINLYRNHTLLTVSEKYHYNLEQHKQLNDGHAKTLSEIETLKSEIAPMVDELKVESAKVDKYSIDIDLIH